MTISFAQVDGLTSTQTLQAIGLSVLATVVFALALRAIIYVRRALVYKAVKATRAYVPAGIGLGEWKLYDSRQLALAANRSLNFGLLALGMFGTYLWLAYVLTLFPGSRAIGAALGGYLFNSTGSLVTGALKAIPGVFTVVIIFAVTRFILRSVNTFFAAVETSAVHVSWVHVDTAAPTRRIVTVMLWLFAIVVAYPYLPGSDSDIFKGVSVFLGVVVSIGSSGLVSQVMSGLVLMYSRALKAGEYVRVGEEEGVVSELGMLSTKICNMRGEIITIPNSVMVNASTTNYSRGENGTAIAVSTAVSIRYSVPWRQVHEILLRAADRTVGLQREPRPFVLQTALGEASVRYELNVQIDSAEHRTRVMARLHENIQDAFSEAHVSMVAGAHAEEPVLALR